MIDSDSFLFENKVKKYEKTVIVLFFLNSGSKLILKD